MMERSQNYALLQMVLNYIVYYLQSCCLPCLQMLVKIVKMTLAWWRLCSSVTAQISIIASEIAGCWSSSLEEKNRRSPSLFSYLNFILYLNAKHFWKNEPQTHRCMMLCRTRSSLRKLQEGEEKNCSLFPLITFGAYAQEKIMIT